jgi:beta-lactam-binding protein with PASTA domain
MPLPVPPDVERALAADPAARGRFDAMPPQTKDAWIAWINRARLPAARRRRIGHMLRVLGAPARRTATGEEVVEEFRPPPPLIWPWLLALAIALLVAALLIWLFAFRDDDGSRSVVVERTTVPNLVGQRRAEAVERAKRAHLTPVNRFRRSAQRAGVVVDQDPRPGKTVRSGSIVMLIVSKGPPRVAVPKVTGLAAADAVQRLQNAKLVPKLMDVTSSEPPGTVVSQKPEPGERAPQGSRVTLGVSRGGGKVTVPSVVGETAAEAVADLKRAKLAAETVSVPSERPRGTVADQSPRGGDRVAAGTTVRLRVSSGPRQVTTTTAPTTTRQTTTVATTTVATTTRPTTTTRPATSPTTTAAAGTVRVPSLTGQRLVSALGALERAGLRATVKYVPSQQPLGQVAGQNPAAGASVRRGTRVQLNVSEGANPGSPTPVPDVVGQDEASARTALEDEGFRVIVIQRRGGATGTVVEQQPTAGTTIAAGDFVAIYVG